MGVALLERFSQAYHYDLQIIYLCTARIPYTKTKKNIASDHTSAERTTIGNLTRQVHDNGIENSNTLTCAFTAVNVSIGGKPLFSAKASGTASNASANDLIAYCTTKKQSEGIALHNFCNYKLQSR